jgi:hypothetical protein
MKEHEWYHAASLKKMKARTITSGGKIKETVFWDDK